MSSYTPDTNICSDEYQQSSASEETRCWVWIFKLQYLFYFIPYLHLRTKQLSLDAASIVSLLLHLIVLHIYHIVTNMSPNLHLPDIYSIHILICTEYYATRTEGDSLEPDKESGTGKMRGKKMDAIKDEIPWRESEIPPQCHLCLAVFVRHSISSPPLSLPT